MEGNNLQMNTLSMVSSMTTIIIPELYIFYSAFNSFSLPDQKELFLNF